MAHLLPDHQARAPCPVRSPEGQAVGCPPCLTGLIEEQKSNRIGPMKSHKGQEVACLPCLTGPVEGQMNNHMAPPVIPLCLHMGPQDHQVKNLRLIPTKYYDFFLTWWIYITHNVPYSSMYLENIASFTFFFFKNMDKNYI